MGSGQECVRHTVACVHVYKYRSHALDMSDVGRPFHAPHPGPADSSKLHHKHICTANSKSAIDLEGGKWQSPGHPVVHQHWLTLTN